MCKPNSGRTNWGRLKQVQSTAVNRSVAKRWVERLHIYTVHSLPELETLEDKTLWLGFTAWDLGLNVLSFCADSIPTISDFSHHRATPRGQSLPVWPPTGCLYLYFYSGSISSVDSTRLVSCPHLSRFHHLDQYTDRVQRWLNEEGRKPAAKTRTTEEYLPMQ